MYVANRGLRASSPEVASRMRAGDSVAPDQYYFRAAPVFDAPNGPQFLAEGTLVPLFPDANGAAHPD
ncbi:hypothetical protein [Aliiruegeria lutimaris]|uniref:hypothetical protein n=1 Tax=Aliiruegeria lutimaris TaxID=571298 RepID=UPI003CC79EBF